MKPTVRPFLYLLLLLLPAVIVANNPGKDFLITLNGSKLTGHIKEISSSEGIFQISFENDMGSTYTVRPETIYGFAIEEEGEFSLYESKCLNGQWHFLRVKKKGNGLSLYTSTERQLQFTNSNESPIVIEEKNPQIWLQFAGEKPLKVHRFSYKGVLRKRMKSYPDLAKRIGKKGFRYRNLPAIVELYNRLYEEKEEQLGQHSF